MVKQKTENLLTSCRKCNTLRGNISYGDWIKHINYNRFIKLPDKVLQANIDLILKLANIPIRVHKQSR